MYQLPVYCYYNNLCRDKSICANLIWVNELFRIGHTRTERKKEKGMERGSEREKKRERRNLPKQSMQKKPCFTLVLLLGGFWCTETADGGYNDCHNSTKHDHGAGKSLFPFSFFSCTSIVLDVRVCATPWVLWEDFIHGQWGIPNHRLVLCSFLPIQTSPSIFWTDLTLALRCRRVCWCSTSEPDVSLNSTSHIETCRTGPSKPLSAPAPWQACSDQLRRMIDYPRCVCVCNVV